MKEFTKLFTIKEVSALVLVLSACLLFAYRGDELVPAGLTESKPEPPRTQQEYGSDRDYELPPNYQKSSRHGFINAARDDSYQDEDSKYDTDEHGAPLFYPSDQALSDSARYDEEYNTFKEAEAEYVAAKTAAIGEHLRQEIGDIEATIQSAITAGTRSQAEIDEAQAALLEMKKLQAKFEED